MFKSKSINSYYVAISVVITLGFSVSFQSLLAAWTAPTQDAPGGAYPMAVNVGTSTDSIQSIIGSVAIGSSLAVNGVSSFLSNVGIGTTTPGEKLEVAGNVKIAGAGLYNSSGKQIIQTNATDWTRWNMGSGATNGNAMYQSLALGTGGLSVGAWSNQGVGNVYATGILQIAGTGNSYINGNLGIGTASPGTRFEIKGGHGDTTARLYSTGDGGANDAYLSLWASEPGWSYTGAGIGNNINGSGYYGRVNAARGGSYIRLLDNAILLNTITSAGVDTNNVALVGGNVGIGMTPGEKLDVNGNVRATAFFYSSDARLKNDIRTIQNPLEDIMKLRGVDFKWKDSGEEDLGVIAQELEKVYPQLVKTDPNTGLKSVQYGNLVAPLIGAIKEQQDMIRSLEERITNLENK